MINSLATGGAERMVVQLAIHGVRAGHEVRVVLLANKEGIPKNLAQEEGLDVMVLGRSSLDPRLAFRLRRALRGADVVHAHLFPAMYWVALMPGVKVFTEHSTHNRRMGNRLFKLPERWAYGRFKRIIAISAGVARRVREHSDNIGSRTALVVATNGVADEFYLQQRQVHDGPLRIVAVGSLTAVKQHRLAIQAMTLLPDATLDIAGDGPFRESLEDLIAELRLASRVRLLGNVQDVPQLLAQSDLLLSTSQYEGFSLVAAEAQAVGLPVVGPKVEGFDEVVVHGESGLLFSDRSPRAIAAMLENAAEADTYMRLARGAVVNARRLSMRVAFRANDEVYRQVLNEVHGARS
ncbi:glycosyltransferase [Microbacterium esteraromaticum]|uniref:glycosyltransferase n=1 Tax=Microbacterium esteraromaticum TaxID=57043 RepID=UPI001C96CEFA|nr:glycosyltransferase [Microbacterium esteraromaticum]MBY6060314.1 glycosyltransferase [Microbacterium esteraromaticum]